MKTGYDKIEQGILNDTNLSEEDKSKFLATFMKYRDKKANILITGATGVGKSSTINAMFNREEAKVGVGVDPETMDTEKFELGSLTLWDSPGLGDGKEKDRQHSKNITDLLLKTDKNGDLLIDVVLVVLDGRSRDLGTSYELINAVIIPTLRDKTRDQTDRLLIGINQADMMLDGRHWDRQNTKPLPKLQERIDEKVESVSQRIYEATKVKVEPVAYSAGYKEAGEPQEQPYNLSKLMYYIIEKIPEEKRISVVAESNSDKRMWEKDDNLIEYRERIVEKTFGQVGREIGSKIGGIFGSVGRSIGGAIGGAIGGFIGGLFGK
ncbi:MAG: 50S ribosome-binding GTPase [Defluviitaleaceae bacterium]|nr:50S ribosome-binding GTPase [Defluviitaleaceae bacterium]